MIFFSRPQIDNTEIKNVKKVLNSRILCDGVFQNKTEKLIKKKIKSKFVALTQSCTDALEMASLLINVKKGDEIILPSYTFTSTANAFALRGASLKFADINIDNLSIDYNHVKKLVTKKTKAIIIVHYGGCCIDMEPFVKLQKKNNFYLIEDCAHSFLASYKKKYVGTFGDIGVYSFHETKNIVAGQGGAISINNNKLIKKANYYLDKGTNRVEFLKNYKKQFISEKKKLKYYSWVSLGSEFRATEISSALIYSQLKKFSKINKARKKIWKIYEKFIKNLNNSNIKLLNYTSNNQNVYHLFVLIAQSNDLARKIRYYMQKRKIPVTFHYVPLHLSNLEKNIIVKI